MREIVLLLMGLGLPGLTSSLSRRGSSGGGHGLASRGGGGRSTHVDCQNQNTDLQVKTTIVKGT